jgi:hypothetical protein
MELWGDFRWIGSRITWSLVWNTGGTSLFFFTLTNRFMVGDWLLGGVG